MKGVYQPLVAPRKLIPVVLLEVIRTLKMTKETGVPRPHPNPIKAFQQPITIPKYHLDMAREVKQCIPCQRH